MTLVIDASAALAALLNDGPAGVWVEDLLRSNELVGPHHLPVEVANVLRLQALSGEISQESATMAHTEMLALPLILYPYEPFADRIWQLRSNVTAYDAWYVAIAESLDASLVTVDGHLTRSAGPRCRFLTPP